MELWSTKNYHRAAEQVLIEIQVLPLGHGFEGKAHPGQQVPG